MLSKFELLCAPPGKVLSDWINICLHQWRMSLRVGMSTPLVCYAYGASPSNPFPDKAIYERQQPHIVDGCGDYALEHSNNSSQLPFISDAMRIVHAQLEKVYIAEASLLKNLEECNNPLDLEHAIDGLNRLRIVEVDMQKLLLAHVSQ
uniref:Mediator of RNA polymerase II transcription subunit 7 n=1 Tax=Angiostrongylus cantonensis TaxID=6313 RepID=A0A0K0D005_ANGCA